MAHKQKILLKEFVTHDVIRFIIEKPENYKFKPGQATTISINSPDWNNKKRPFTFTSKNNDLVLEFIIKIYPEHGGVTNELSKLSPGNELILEDPWGTIQYKGPGIFIAGGAGITPFIAIFRELNEKNKLENNKLIFSNKTSKDIILEKELKQIFKENLILLNTQEGDEKINKEWLKQNIKDFNQNFYICGPPSFVKDITEALKELGANTDEVIFEE